MRLHRTHAAPRHPRWRTAALPSAAVALVGAWISGCSVLYDLSTEQCSIDADCAALGPDFEGMACVQHICQAACETNSDCIDSLGNGNVAWACVSRECVQLETAECPQVLPKINDKWLENLRSPNALILAGMGADGSYDARMRNYDLALTEFSNNAGAGQRPLVMLGCKAAVDSNEELDLMMTHLTQTVKVPAMVSALLADDMDYAFRNYAQGAHTFVMSAQESDP
ncbi:MAG TPA: hypothetical protein VNN80_03050, partial [Polyangiaceae bacterium]|nr:hypothetical protein [Polyangiaceae bacterium]